MNLLRTFIALLPAVLAVPVAGAQTGSANPAATVHVEAMASSDELLADPPGREALSRVPWAAHAPTVYGPASASTQTDFVFIDEVPLQAGMFDQPTAWEDEP